MYQNEGKKCNKMKLNIQNQMSIAQSIRLIFIRMSINKIQMFIQCT